MAEHVVEQMVDVTRTASSGSRINFCCREKSMQSEPGGQNFSQRFVVSYSLWSKRVT